MTSRNLYFFLNISVYLVTHHCHNSARTVCAIENAWRSADIFHEWISSTRAVKFLQRLRVASDPDAGAARISQLHPARKYLAGVGVTLAAARFSPAAGCFFRPLHPWNSRARPSVLISVRQRRSDLRRRVRGPPVAERVRRSSRATMKPRHLSQRRFLGF